MHIFLYINLLSLGHTLSFPYLIYFVEYSDSDIMIVEYSDIMIQS